MLLIFKQKSVFSIICFLLQIKKKTFNPLTPIVAKSIHTTKHLIFYMQTYFLDQMPVDAISTHTPFQFYAIRIK